MISEKGYMDRAVAEIEWAYRLHCCRETNNRDSEVIRSLESAKGNIEIVLKLVREKAEGD